MSLTKCRECGKEVSTEAKACPHCGIKNPAPPSRAGNVIKLIIGAVMLAFIVKCINTGEEAKNEKAAAEARKTPEQRAAEAARETEFQNVVARLRALKASTKNPASFELVSATLMNDGTLCAEYRGTNSFNAVVPGQTAITSAGAVVPWNKHCAGKSGRDFLFARQAL
jgi:hypothetical protein